ncbi:unnamed protein product [Caenorhabditis nigoni]
MMFLFIAICQFAWKTYWKHWRKAGILSYHVVLSCVLLSFGFLAPDQETAIRSVFTKLPCLPQYIYEANIYVLCEDYTYHLVSCVTIGLSALFTGVSFAALLVRNAVVQLQLLHSAREELQMRQRVAILFHHYNQAEFSFLYHYGSSKSCFRNLYKP